MTDNAILARFSKSGDLHHLSRRFHNLDVTGRRYVLDLMQLGVGADKAIRIVKRQRAKGEIQVPLF
jgi:hypothetical protein